MTKADFNSYGSRRGNHEVMMRGTFANVRIKNLMLPARRTAPRGRRRDAVPAVGEQMFIYDAAMRYVAQGTPTVVFGGEEYGSGSSRDWAAKGTQLLGVKAVIARSFERIHRSNLVGMGVLPLQFKGTDSVAVARHHRRGDVRHRGAEGHPAAAGPDARRSRARTARARTSRVLCRIDTPIEVDYYNGGGILPFVLRDLMAA